MRSLLQLVLALFFAVAGWAGEGKQAVVIPAEARKVLAHVQATGKPLPGYVGGRTFGNYEKRLPLKAATGKKIRYQEWDIHPKVPGKNRGAERLVTGDDRRAWYTADHYASFLEIK